MTSQRSHVKTMWFSAFSDVFSAGHGQVFSFWKSGTHSCHWMFFYSIISIKSVAADLFHKNNQLQHLLHFLCELLSVSSFPIMDSTPPTSRRVKSRVVRSGGRLEGWFSGDNDLIERYRFETSTKVINNPKVVCFDWLKSISRSEGSSKINPSESSWRRRRTSSQIW